jgi:hypothetical protein
MASKYKRELWYERLLEACRKRHNYKIKQELKPKLEKNKTSKKEIDWDKLKDYHKLSSIKNFRTKYNF